MSETAGPAPRGANESFMAEALRQAEAALSNGQFPVGCVMVQGDRILASGARMGTSGSMASELDHAEMVALRRLEALNRPLDYQAITLFCTMEPCLMCYGALLIRGVGRIVYAYEDAMGGATRCDLSSLSPLYASRKPVITPHVLRGKSLSLFQRFFSNPSSTYWKNSLLAEYTLSQ